MSGATIGGVVGGVIGFVVSGFNPVGAQIGFALGSLAGGALDPQHLQGPSLGDIPVQTSQEGLPRPIVYGAPQPFPGNIIMAGPKVRSIKEEKQGKGGGPVIESEQVHQTYAIRICEGPAKVLEILRDGKLVFSRTGTRPLDADSAGFASKIVLYEGNETQLPDASLEGLPAANGGGAGNVPAHRGTAYMVVVHDDLTPTGGRIPNYEFRMASSATLVNNCVEAGLIAWWPLDDAVTGIAREIVAGRNGVYNGAVAVGPSMNYSGDASVRFSAWNQNMKVTGTAAQQLSVAGMTAWSFGIWVNAQDATSHAQQKVLGVAYTNDFDGRYSWGMSLAGIGTADGMHPSGGFTNAVPVEFRAQDPAALGVGSTAYLVVTYSSEASGTLRLYKNAVLVNTVTGIGTSSMTVDHIQFGGSELDGNHGFIGYLQDAKLYNFALSQAQIAAQYVSTSEPFFELPDSAGSFVSPDGTVHTFCPGRATPNTIYLSDIELDIAARVGLAASQFDVSELTAIPVEGFLIGKQMAASAALQPLATAYFHDLPESDLRIHARRRGGPSVVTLTDDDFVDSGDDEEIRAQAIELPRKLNLYFSDPSVNHAVVPVPAERVSTNVKATGIASVEVPIVLNRDLAKQKAEIMLKVIYEESQGRLIRELPAFKHANLVASDPITFDSKRWRINTLEQLEGTIKIDSVRDRISNYTSTATANTPVDPTDPASNLKGPSILYAMNLPRLRTQDNQPGVYLAVTGVLPGWPGAAIYVSTDGGVTEELMTVVNARATLGKLDTAIDADDAAFTAWVYDNRDLESVTAADLALRRNAFAILTSNVAEIGQFQTATQTVTNNHWSLTNVTRPRLGTTAASHAAGDRFVLLDGAIQFLPLSASLIGRTLIFRAVTLGTANVNNDTVSLLFAPLFTGPEEVDYYKTETGEIYLANDGSYYRAE